MTSDTDTFLERYMDKMRSDGCCNLEFDISSDLRKKYQIESKIFTKHDEIETYWQTVNDKSRNAFKYSVMDLQLIRAFNRIFWIRYYKSGATTKPPVMKQFENPLETTFAMQKRPTLDQIKSKKKA